MAEFEHIEPLLITPELGESDPERNKKFWYCSRAGKLRESGFTIMKLDFEGEVPDHYSVQLGDPAELTDAERFVAALEPRKRG
ncbi:hypothetical protein [Gordonia malaquae]|uniref:hypothetical protein n=1 Tax=Gordonia malaquae TaxID=410332 RepID=UPI0030FF31E5